MNMIVTCTVNPAIDLSTEIDRVEPFRKLRCGDARRDPGGGGVNVARVLHRLGAEVTAVFTAGGATGQLLKDLVQREGFTSRPIPVSGETREDFTVVETSSGHEFRFVLPGAPLSPGEEEAIVAAVEAIPAPAFVVVSGSLPPHATPALYRNLIAVAKAKGATTVLDTSGPALAETLEAGVDIVKPNRRELSEMTGTALATEADQIEAARTLVQTRRARMVALTLAERGAVLVTRDRTLRASAPKVVPVSTVGAGDSFLAALVFALASGLSHEDALCYGVAAGTAALLSAGTGLCHKSQVERLRALVSVERLADAWV
jgi:6-phosphofructokinase 2